METLFISDLHLSPERPHKLELFKQLLRGPARKANALYILGDLFEQFWVGIDDMTPPNPEIVRELADFTRSGARLFIQKGNRELLLDQRFGDLTGSTVLPDKTIINLNGERVLLMHGDLLCSRDWKYQAYRRFVMYPPCRKIFSCLPYRTRILLTQGLRPAMQRSTMRKTAEIMDVDQTTVEQTLKANNVTEIIHGHTHRPGIFEFNLGGVSAKRTVLGDWYAEELILVCSTKGRSLIPVSEYLQNNR